MASRMKKGGLAAVVMAICLAAVARWEGEKFMPYQDIGGVWTVCKGHTGVDVIPGKAWTKAQCDAQDKADLQAAADAIAPCIVVPISDLEQVAYVDFAYNAGAGTFCRSSMARLANAGRRREACDYILRYVYVGKRDCRLPGSGCPGIVKRRQWQRDQCMKGVQGDVQVAG